MACAALPRLLRIAQWNGAPPLGQPIQLVLETLGFRRDALDIVWDGRLILPT
ncbi:MAG: hypothetical protein GXY52_10785 [Chloroflexi bacterium]|nr:hypothetical protein [Chloroflexota bacterium]